MQISNEDIGHTNSELNFILFVGDYIDFGNFMLLFLKFQRN